MARKCKSCGAPLDISTNEEYIKCNYCGTINSNQSIFQIINKFFGGSTFNKSVTVLSVKGQINRKRNKTVTVLILFVVALSIIIPLLFVFQHTTKLAWASDCQFIDYNIDDVLDIVGFTRKTSSWEILTVIDGKSGEVLVKKDILKAGSIHKIFCIDKKYIISQDAFNTVNLYNNKDLSIKQTFDLEGNIKSYKMIDDVLCLKLWNNDVFGFSVKTSEEKECSPNGNFVSLPEDLADKDNESINYSFEKGNTKDFIITAVEDNKSIWSCRLKDFKLFPSNSYVITPEYIVLFGEKKGEKERAYIIGIDKKTGDKKYEVIQSLNYAVFFHSYYNDKYVIVYWSNGLIAYEPENGKTAWCFACEN